MIDLICKFPDTPIPTDRLRLVQAMGVATIDVGSLSRTDRDALFNNGAGPLFASMASGLRRQHGDGLLLVYFSSIESCEDTATGLALHYRQTRTFGAAADLMPRVGYVLWPLDRSPDNEQCRNIETSSAVMDTVISNPDRMFALYAMVAPSAPERSDGAMQIRSCSFTNPLKTRAAGSSKKKAMALDASAEASRIAAELTDDPSFFECRRLLLTLRERRSAGGGVIWLRNLDDNTNGYDFDQARGLSAITPAKLEAAILRELDLSLVSSRCLLLTISHPFSSARWKTKQHWRTVFRRVLKIRHSSRQSGDNFVRTPSQYAASF
eukprot:4335311-Prymnesium_polylepis.2